MRVAYEWSDIKAVEFVKVAITSDGRLDDELDTRIDKDSTVMQALHYSVVINPICTGGGKFALPLSYFNIAPKRKQSFALMHPDFESNLITHIFRKFGVSRTAGSDVIFAFVRGT